MKTLLIHILSYRYINFDIYMTFDLAEYEALLNERKAFFNGQKFFDNAIMGTPTQCLHTIQTIQKEIITHAHLVLKPSASDHAHNRWMLSLFNAEIRPYI
jgi:hypothetical protein